MRSGNSLATRNLFLIQIENRMLKIWVPHPYKYEKLMRVFRHRQDNKDSELMIIRGEPGMACLRHCDHTTFDIVIPIITAYTIKNMVIEIKGKECNQHKNFSS